MRQRDLYYDAGWGEKPAGAPGFPAPGAAGSGGDLSLQPTQDLNVAGIIPLVSPRRLEMDLPMTPAANRTIVQSRQTIREILAGADRRLLVVVGPCSIHDEAAALEYAERLTALARQLADGLHLVMRVYFEKPRTVTGWKGLINDPYLDGSFDMEAGMRKAREILLKINARGLPAGTEVLDPITPAYLADLLAWAAIGARTIESQTHRQMASGLSMPVGYKNGTEGNLQIAVDAMRSSRAPHGFLGIDHDGRTAIVKTRGNKLGHLILRGGLQPNHDAASVAHAVQLLHESQLSTALMVDCNHANALKKFQNAHKVWDSVLEQRAAGNSALIGLLLESNLVEGNQPLPADPSHLRYGVSITDECVGWEETEDLLRRAHRAMTR